MVATDRVVPHAAVSAPWGEKVEFVQADLCLSQFGVCFVLVLLFLFCVCVCVLCLCFLLFCLFVLFVGLFVCFFAGLCAVLVRSFVCLLVSFYGGSVVPCLSCKQT